MKISSRFSVAIHILVLLECGKDKIFTSEFIAGSVNTNPVVIRRIMGKLKEAGLIDVKSGTGGAHLLKAPEEISLYDVYKAGEVVSAGELFNIHEHPNTDCPVGAKIQGVLEIFLSKAQEAMEQVLKDTSIKDILEIL